MPHAAEIPPSIKELTFRQALKVGSDPEFNSDVERLNKALNTLLHEGAHEGYCYLNRGGIDQLMAKMEIAPSKNPSYRNKVLTLLARLDARGVLSTLARPGEHQFVLLTSHFAFVEEDKTHLAFRSDAHGFRMHMAKLKSTFWPRENLMPSLSHVRIALCAGVDLQIFGEWYSVDYLRPHAASVVGYNLGGMNTLF